MNERDHRDTDPAPALATWWEQAIGGKVELADDGWTSDAGEIVNLKHHGVPGTVSVLYTRPGKTRASHFHRRDTHVLFVISGEVHYYERAIGDETLPDPQVFKSGEMFFTPSGREHVLYFPVYTIMVSMSSRTRAHEEHEADVVRVNFQIRK